MKRFLSYLWPISKKVASKYSGDLEITLFKGKKMLDTKNANYSYGAQTKVIEKGLDNIAFSNVNAVLMLGLGGGSIVYSLRKKYAYKSKIDVVEIDENIIDIAKKEFNLAQCDKLNIIHQDALVSVQETTNKYDLVIVDIFIDAKVPKVFYSNQFADNLYNLLNKNAKVVFNLGINLQKEDVAWDFVQYLERKGMKIKIFENVERFNTVLVAKTV